MIQVIKGNFIYTKTMQALELHNQEYMVVKDGVIKGIYPQVPSMYKRVQVTDYKNHLIIPAFSDIHVHAPQYMQRGLGLDKELLPWLNQYTFPAESRYEDIQFAKEAYKEFINNLWYSGSLRSVVFATKHKLATYILCELFEQSGLKAYVGKVNMDQYSDSRLQEVTRESVEDTMYLIEKVGKTFQNVKYIVTPRFVPVTSSELMKQLGDLVERYNLPVQSHLAENRSEVQWVKDLYPGIRSFTEVYEAHGLLPANNTIMAHGIYLDEKERQLLKKKNVLIAHCAQSNKNLSSGIMAARKYIEEGLRVGIASDVGAGHVLSMNRHIVESIQASKLNWVQHINENPLSVVEAFYMATKENGRFFGKTGSFEEGYFFDALVIERGDSQMSLEEAFEQYIYIGDERQILKRIIEGKIVEKPF